MGGLHDLDLGHVPVDPRVLVQRRRLPRRSIRRRRIGAVRRGNCRVIHRRRLAGLRPAVPLAARSKRRCVQRGAAGADYATRVRPVPALQRARRLHSFRGRARHDHGRECFLRDHPGPAQDGGGSRTWRATGPAGRHQGQAAVGTQHLLYAAGAVRHDQQPLRAHLHARIQLGNPRGHFARRCADTRVLRGTTRR